MQNEKIDKVFIELDQEEFHGRYISNVFSQEDSQPWSTALLFCWFWLLSYQLSFFADFGCLVMAVPYVLIGAIAKNTSK